MSRAISAALTGIGLAQLLKVPWEYANTGQWNLGKIAESGGMPSSHSAAVSALSTYIACKKGADSLEFALSALLSLIVMYDAMGVRRQAGLIAIEVNDLDVQVEKLTKKQPGIHHERKEHKLKEQIGHMPREVLGGALLGIVVGAAYYSLERL